MPRYFSKDIRRLSFGGFEFKDHKLDVSDEDNQRFLKLVRSLPRQEQAGIMLMAERPTSVPRGAVPVVGLDAAPTTGSSVSREAMSTDKIAEKQVGAGLTPTAAAMAKAAAGGDGQTADANQADGDGATDGTDGTDGTKPAEAAKPAAPAANQAPTSGKK